MFEKEKENFANRMNNSVLSNNTFLRKNSTIVDFENQSKMKELNNIKKNLNNNPKKKTEIQINNLQANANNSKNVIEVTKRNLYFF